MKHILYLIITFLLCLGINGYAQNDTTGTTVPQQDKNTIKIYVENDSIKPMLVGSNTVFEFEQLPTPEPQEEEWYNTDWFHYVLIGALVLLLIMIIIEYFLSKDCMTKQDTRVLVVDEIRNYAHHHAVSNVQTVPSGNNTREIRQLQEQIRRLESELQTLRQTSQQIVNQLQQAKKSPEPKAPVQNPTQPATVEQNGKKMYAVQNASAANELKDISASFDKYTHTFVITLDAKSQTDGSFEIVNDDYVIQKCLQNEDALRCCTKTGNGKRIVRQEPGRITIKGSTALVTKNAIIHTS